MIQQAKIVPSFIFGNPNYCTYCGNKSNSIDHVIPISSYRNRHTKGGKDAGVRTYACMNCNGILGSKHFDTFRQRLEFVIGKITKAAAKFQRTASWSDEEIAEMDHTLRTYIANRQIEMRVADRRTVWATTYEFRASMETLKGVHCLNKESPKFTKWIYDYFEGYTPKNS